MNELVGFLLIKKPEGITSFNCVARIKRLVGKGIKVGHAGTLDRFATGLLIIAIDRLATRHIDTFMRLDKEYVAQGKLGAVTDTLDATGTIIQECPVVGVTHKKLLEVINTFGTSYQQIPPIYSALSYKGRRLYELARKKTLSDEELVRIAQEKARTVQLHAIELLNFELPYFTIKARVSHGTYIRSLINDIAQRAGSCATTYALERVAIGPLLVDDAIDLGELRTIDDVKKYLITLDNMLERLR